MLLDWWSGHHLRYDSQVSRAPLGCSGWAFQAEGCPYSQWYLTVHSPWRRSWCMIIMVRHSSPSVFAFFLHLYCFRIRHTHLHGSGVFFPFFWPVSISEWVLIFYVLSLFRLIEPIWDTWKTKKDEVMGGDIWLFLAFGAWLDSLTAIDLFYFQKTLCFLFASFLAAK